MKHAFLLFGILLAANSTYALTVPYACESIETTKTFEAGIVPVVSVSVTDIRNGQANVIFSQVENEMVQLPETQATQIYHVQNNSVYVGANISVNIDEKTLRGTFEKENQKTLTLRCQKNLKLN